MIYVDLEDWGDIMDLVQKDQRFNTVYDYYLGSRNISNWSLRIACFNKWACYRFYAGAGQILLHLKLIRDLNDLWPTGPVEEPTPMSHEDRETALSDKWRPLVEKAIQDLDLLTLGSRGRIYIPGEAQDI